MTKSQNWPLSKLVSGIALTCATGENSSDMAITSLACDSRKVTAGSLFIAVPGVAVDGASFIPMAIEKGAVAIICDARAEIPPLPIPLLRADNIRLALSQLAARFYGTQPKHVVAITGTNGKTSTAHFCQQLWQLLGEESASIGTLGIRTNQGLLQNNGQAVLTTPDPIGLHQNLANLAKNGVTHLAMEASSHGLDQYRMHGVTMEAAIFTSFSRDHLDYHHTEAAYLEAKLTLFRHILPEGKIAIINADMPAYAHVRQACLERHQQVISYGFKEGADVHIQHVEPSASGQKLVFSYQEKSYTVDIPLIGKFQIENLLAAMLAVGEDIPATLALLPKVTPVRGRMETVINDSGKIIVIDYAHTPDALEKALQELRPYLTQGKQLWVVFGCGGDRDTGKRPQMGAIANRYADQIIVTDDNPRTEAAQGIRKAILEACPDGVEVADRAHAITHAIENMEAGDVLLIAGKGHETYQIIGKTYHDFDDREVVRKSI
jgi:UDP-N-acetylmuramoyl-L-alanyl-D-glutamate--2,6-diaminopimelate ligase